MKLLKQWVKKLSYSNNNQKNRSFIWKTSDYFRLWSLFQLQFSCLLAAAVMIATIAVIHAQNQNAAQNQSAAQNHVQDHAQLLVIHATQAMHIKNEHSQG